MLRTTPLPHYPTTPLPHYPTTPLPHIPTSPHPHIPISPYPHIPISHIRSAATQRRTEWRCRCGAVLHSERVYWPFLRGFDEKGCVQSSHLPVPCGAWPFQVLPPTDFVNSIRSDISHGHPYSLDAFINHKECDQMRRIAALLRLPFRTNAGFSARLNRDPA